MLKFQEIYEVDEELLLFQQAQKEYHLLAQDEVTWESLTEDMQIPQGFKTSQHHCFKIYKDDQMIGFIDFLYGYCYSMIHDNEYIWIGLFIIDEKHQRQHIGTQVMEYFIKEYKKQCSHIQLGCLQKNPKGLSFWKSLGFYQIGESYSQQLPVWVLQCDI